MTKGRVLSEEEVRSLWPHVQIGKRSDGSPIYADDAYITIRDRDKTIAEKDAKLESLLGVFYAELTPEMIGIPQGTDVESRVAYERYKSVMRSTQQVLHAKARQVLAQGAEGSGTD